MLIKACQNNHFTMWLGLTTTNIRRHLPKSLATTLGHLDQEHKNLQSTQPILIPPSKEPAPIRDDTKLLPSPVTTDGIATNFAYSSLENLPKRTGSIATDKTGQFPLMPSTRMCYVLVLYDYDSYAILADPLKNCTRPEMLCAYKNLHQLLVSHGLCLKLQ
jgi:hypothetical protein